MNNQTIQRVSQAQRHKRRQTIARDVEEGLTLAEAASRHGMSISTARSACQEHGVHCGRMLGPAAESFAILRHALDGQSRTDIATKFGISRQRVHQIIDSARAGGWTIP